MAIRLAMILNCQNPPAPDECCGTCRMCRLIERGEHPDLMVVATENPGEILKIDAIRDLQRQLNLTPYEAKWRVAIILRFEEANIAAQNALLKTLEEPPARVKLFLTASSENAVLPTILSRCEPIRVMPMPVSDLITALTNEAAPEEDPDEDLIRRAAHLSNGRVGFCKTLLEDVTRVENYESIAQEYLGLTSQNTREKFSYAQGFRDIRKRGELRDLFQVWEVVLRDLLLIAANVDSDVVPLSFIGLRDEMAQAANGKGPETYRVQIGLLRQALADLNANVTPQLVLENYLIRV